MTMQSNNSGKMIRVRYKTVYIFVFVLVIAIVVSVTFIRSLTKPIYSAGCMTMQQVVSDSRCLRVVNNKVYQKGSRTSLHHGHPCGIDVTSILPSFHTDSMSKYMTPNYIADLCSQPTPTTVPSPTSIPTVIPSIIPTATSVPPSPTLFITSVPTATLAPTVPPAAGSTLLTVALNLHGIGNAGDNVESPGAGNQRPVRPQRIVTASLYGTTGAIVMAVQGVVTYSSSDGSFRGTLNLGTALQSGLYTVKIATQSYLKRQVSAIISITKGGTTALPVVSLTAGDTNNDNKIDAVDYNLLLDCFSDLTTARNCADQNKKLSTDLNDDGIVNQFDYNIFIRELSVQKGE